MVVYTDSTPTKVITNTPSTPTSKTSSSQSSSGGSNSSPAPLTPREQNLLDIARQTGYSGQSGELAKGIEAKNNIPSQAPDYSYNQQAGIVTQGTNTYTNVTGVILTPTGQLKDVMQTTEGTTRTFSASSGAVSEVQNAQTYVNMDTMQLLNKQTGEPVNVRTQEGLDQLARLNVSISVPKELAGQTDYYAKNVDEKQMRDVKDVVFTPVNTLGQQYFNLSQTGTDYTLSWNPSFTLTPGLKASFESQLKQLETQYTDVQVTESDGKYIISPKAITDSAYLNSKAFGSDYIKEAKLEGGVPTVLTASGKSINYADMSPIQKQAFEANILPSLETASVESYLQISPANTEITGIIESPPAFKGKMPWDFTASTFPLNPELAVKASVEAGNNLISIPAFTKGKLEITTPSYQATKEETAEDYQMQLFNDPNGLFIRNQVYAGRLPKSDLVPAFSIFLLSGKPGTAVEDFLHGFETARQITPEMNIPPIYGVPDSPYFGILGHGLTIPAINTPNLYIPDVKIRASDLINLNPIAPQEVKQQALREYQIINQRPLLANLFRIGVGLSPEPQALKEQTYKDIDLVFGYNKQPQAQQVEVITADPFLKEYFNQNPIYQYGKINETQPSVSGENWKISAKDIDWSNARNLNEWSLGDISISRGAGYVADIAGNTGKVLLTGGIFATQALNAYSNNGLKYDTGRQEGYGSAYYMTPEERAIQSNVFKSEAEYLVQLPIIAPFIIAPLLNPEMIPGATKPLINLGGAEKATETTIGQTTGTAFNVATGQAINPNPVSIMTPVTREFVEGGIREELISGGEHFIPIHQVGDWFPVSDQYLQTAFAMKGSPILSAIGSSLEPASTLGEYSNKAIGSGLFTASAQTLADLTFRGEIRPEETTRAFLGGLVFRSGIETGKGVIEAGTPYWDQATTTFDDLTNPKPIAQNLYNAGSEVSTGLKYANLIRNVNIATLPPSASSETPKYFDIAQQAQAYHVNPFEAISPTSQRINIGLSPAQLKINIPQPKQIKPTISTQPIVAQRSKPSTLLSAGAITYPAGAFATVRPKIQNANQYYQAQQQASAQSINLLTGQQASVRSLSSEATHPNLLTGAKLNLSENLSVGAKQSIKIGAKIATQEAIQQAIAEQIKERIAVKVLVKEKIRVPTRPPLVPTAQKSFFGKKNNKKFKLALNPNQESARTLYSDLFSVAKSQSRFGTATSPNARTIRKYNFYKGEAYRKIPTVELIKAGKGLKGFKPNRAKRQRFL